MQGGDDLSIEELVSNLSNYKDQLRQVKRLLADGPANSEYVDMKKELEEVIELTEELLSTAKQNEPGTSTGTASISQFVPDEQPYLDRKFTIGTKVEAVWSEDGEWYDATIKALTPNGYFVAYDKYGNKEEVDPLNVREKEVEEKEEVNPLQEAEREAIATKEALKRKIQQSSFVTEFEAREVPSKLKIDPNDPDEVKAAKKKKIHAFKSKERLEKLEVVQNKKVNAWQQFQTTKAKTKQVGFYTGRKRESIFKSPDDPKGKVGVIGSGKGLTEFQRREKHLHLKGSSLDGGAED